MAVPDLASVRQLASGKISAVVPRVGRTRFCVVDRYLDLAQTGPRYLQEESITVLVIDSLFHGAELGHFQLGAFCVMANHVHALVLPRIPPSRLMKSIKGYTAHEANRILGRTGEPFWQRETYDHWVRDPAEWQRIAAYIENNPVKAGLVPHAGDYRWSSAHEAWRTKLASMNGAVEPPCVGKNADVARTSACSTR